MHVRRPSRRGRDCLAAALPLAFILAVAPPAAAQASGPQAALHYREPGLPAALDGLERARADARRAELGLSAGLELEPGLEYGGSLGTPEDTGLELGLDIGLELGLRYDRPHILREAIDLVQAEERVRDSERRGIEAALNAHGHLLRAQLAWQRASRRLREAREKAAGYEAGAEKGGAGEFALEASRHELRVRQFDLDEASALLRAARARAAHYGVGGEAVFEPLRFVLPPAVLEAAFDYRQLQLEVALAEALGLQGSAFAVLDDLRLTGRLEGTNYHLDGALSLDRGRPGLELAATYDQTDDDDWEVGLAATLRFDDQTFTSFHEAELAKEAARQELAAFAEVFALETAEARSIAAFAERELSLSAGGLDLARRRVEALRARCRIFAEQLAAARAAGRAAETVRLERALEDAREHLASATRAREEAEDGLYGDWLDYIEQAGDYLELIDGRWEPAARPAAGEAQRGGLKRPSTAVQPPSTIRSEPVTNEAAAEAR